MYVIYVYIILTMLYEVGTVITPIYRQGTERLCKLPEVTELLSERWEFNPRQCGSGTCLNPQPWLLACH